MQRHTCVILTAAAPALRSAASARDLASAGQDRSAFLRSTYESLTRLLVSDAAAVSPAAAAAAVSTVGGGHGVDANWPAVCEAAVGALFALHPRPAALAGAALARLSAAAGLTDGAWACLCVVFRIRLCACCGVCAIARQNRPCC